MRHFDLHCDTLSRCVAEKASLVDNGFDISLEKGQIFDCWVQAFAAFINDDLRGAKAYHAFQAQAAVLQKAVEAGKAVSYDPDNLREGVCNAMLTVENGAALGGKLERIREFAEMGVRVFSLVWNGENELAGGVQSESGADGTWKSGGEGAGEKPDRHRRFPFEYVRLLGSLRDRRTPLSCHPFQLL